MVIYLILIFYVQACLTFISPDELRGVTAYCVDPSFSKVNFFPNYAKLRFVNVNDCAISGNFNQNEAVVVFEKDLNRKCPLVDLANSVGALGGGALFLIVTNSTDYYYYSFYINFEAEEFYYPFEGTSPTNTFALLIYGIEDIMENYKNNSVNIWAKYGYKQIPEENRPNIKYFIGSDYSIDQLFFNELSDLVFDYNLEFINLEISFLYNYTSIEFQDEDCISTSNDPSENIIFCLNANSYATGQQRIMTSVIILNYYYSLPSSTLLSFFTSFLTNVYTKCIEDYSEECISGVIINNGGVPNLDPYILSLHYSKFILWNPCYSVNGIFLYAQGYLYQAYEIGQFYSDGNFYLVKCSSGCEYYKLHDLACDNACNVSSCGYDNLLCLQENDCYYFMLDDGNCNSVCPSDPDCDYSNESTSDDSDHAYLLLEIIVPIIGGVLM